ncbi:hypothetical protein THAOC_29046, partial [Thalassiosira oceanica]
RPTPRGAGGDAGGATPAARGDREDSDSYSESRSARDGRRAATRLGLQSSSARAPASELELDDRARRHRARRHRAQDVDVVRAVVPGGGLCGDNQIVPSKGSTSTDFDLDGLPTRAADVVSKAQRPYGSEP